MTFSHFLAEIAGGQQKGKKLLCISHYGPLPNEMEITLMITLCKVGKTGENKLHLRFFHSAVNSLKVEKRVTLHS